MVLSILFVGYLIWFGPLQDLAYFFLSLYIIVDTLSVISFFLVLEGSP